MEIGMIGLGRMGGNMAERLLNGGHKVTGFDPDKDARGRLVSKGAAEAQSIPELTENLPQPRIVWMMVPAGKAVDQTIESLLPNLSAKDIIIDGGNSNYKDSMRRSQMLKKEKGIAFIDVGVSGGVWGLREGYSMMVGGEKEAVEGLNPIFETLAPAPDTGWGYMGPSGSGHFVKMIHNGIEYGMMQAYAEGFAIMKQKKEFDLDLHNIAEVWRYGSVVRSWLLDLISNALEESQDLSKIAPYVSDSGEGRWTVSEAIDLDVTAPVITLSLLQRLRSRDKESFSDRLLAAMRQQFGGHAIKKEK